MENLEDDRLSSNVVSSDSNCSFLFFFFIIIIVVVVRCRNTWERIVMTLPIQLA